MEVRCTNLCTGLHKEGVLSLWPLIAFADGSASLPPPSVVSSQGYHFKRIFDITLGLRLLVLGDMHWTAMSI
jgi:hypothetical protein